MNKSLRKRKMTRFQFEKMLGGSFEENSSGVRRNGRFETFKEYSREVEKRIDCYCRNMTNGITFSGESWLQLATKMEMNKNGHG